MFHHKLLELESELVAAEQSKKNIGQLPPGCLALLEFLQNQVEGKLGDKVPADWKGWLSYERQKQSLVVLRGKAFKEGMFGSCRAGADFPLGMDTVTDYKRGFDVSPPQDLDHLLINFGLDQDKYRVFLWYGENIAPYKLVFAADLVEEPHQELSEAIVEACIWIVKRPKHMTLQQYLQSAQ